jgi:hypothetical protein
MPTKTINAKLCQNKSTEYFPCTQIYKTQGKIELCPTIFCLYFIIPHGEQTPSVHTVYENDQVLLCKSYEINTVGEQNSKILNSA